MGQDIVFDFSKAHVVEIPSRLTVRGGEVFEQEVVITTLVEDTFTDADGTLLSAHTPDTDVVGGGWLGDTGSADIQGNQLRLTANLVKVWIETNEPDVKVEVDWTPAVGVINRGILPFRVTDTNNFLQFNFREEDGDLAIHKVVDGTTTLLDSDVFTWTEGQTYRLKVVASGTSIDIYVDEGLVLSIVESTHQTATKHGIGRPTGADATRYDNFKVTL